MGFYGLSELTDNIKEVNNGLNLKNGLGMFENSTLSSELSKELNGVDDINKLLIAELLGIIYRDKEKIDDEVRVGIKKLKCVDKADLKLLISFKYEDVSKIHQIFNSLLNFDKGFTREDYGNCLFPQSDEKISAIMDMDRVEDSLLYVMANNSYANRIINNELNKSDTHRHFKL